MLILWFRVSHPLLAVGGNPGKQGVGPSVDGGVQVELGRVSRF